MLHQFAETLGAAIDAKDPFTRLNSDEVAEISHSIALSMGLSSSKADIIHMAGHLHDIGKIGIPDAVLNKTGSLNREEWHSLKQHPDIVIHPKWRSAYKIRGWILLDIFTKTGKNEPTTVEHEFKSSQIICFPY